MSNYRELLLGCGIDRRKKLSVEGTPKEFQNATTLDIDPNVDPHVVWDLNVIPYPFQDAEFDEIHAYEVLEHFGKQGDYKAFFAQFNELDRILKVGGLLVGTVPSWNGKWAWGDPGHTRVINEGTLAFLDQSKYGKPPMTDYRDLYHGDLRALVVKPTENHLMFVLQKHAYSRGS
jgi:SAM-dependent methyltransferase